MFINNTPTITDHLQYLYKNKYFTHSFLMNYNARWVRVRDQKTSTLRLHVSNTEFYDLKGPYKDFEKSTTYLTHHIVKKSITFLDELTITS